MLRSASKINLLGSNFIDRCQRHTQILFLDFCDFLMLIYFIGELISKCRHG